MNDINSEKTISYYNSHAKEYFDTTVNIDMSEIMNRFLKFVPPNGKIIDIGAGSGRDMVYFRDLGYQVDGLDASIELCKLASTYTGKAIECICIEEWEPGCKYDGIWANASLVHLTEQEIETFILRVPAILSSNGVAYFSFKSGISDGEDPKGRYFTNMTEEKINRIVGKCPSLTIADLWTTEDKLARGSFNWLNLIIKII